MKLSLHFIHHYLTHSFTILLGVVLLNLLNLKDAHVLSYTLIVVGIMIMYGLFFRQKGRKFMYILIPIAAIIMFVLDYFWLSIIIGAVLPIIKLEYLHHDEDSSRPEIPLLISLLIALTLNFVAFTELNDYWGLIYGIVIAQFLFYFVFGLIVLIYKNGEPALNNVRIFLYSSLLLFGLTGLFILAIRHIIYYGTFVLVALVNAFIFLLRPIFDTLENVELSYPEMPEETETDELQERGDAHDEEMRNQDLTSNIPIEWIMLGIFVAIVAVVIVLYFLKRGDLTKKEKRKVVKNTSTRVERKKHKRRAKDIAAPEDKVRHEYFNFEKWVAERGLGRYDDETIDDWINRMEFNNIIKPTDFDVYRETRYLSKEVSEEDYRDFKANIERIKKAIAELKTND